MAGISNSELLAIGAVFAILYLDRRFNQPFADRSYTVRSRYAAGLAIYLLPYLILYVGLAFISLSGSVLPWPPWLAIITVWILPKLPIASTVDRWLLGFGHQVAGIPGFARRWASMLHTTEIKIRKDAEGEIRMNLLRRGYKLYDFGAEPDRSLFSRLVRASLLMHYLDRWSTEKRYKRFLLGHQPEYTSLKGRYDHLSFKAATDLSNIAGMNAMIDEGSGGTEAWDSLDTIAEAEAYRGSPDPVISTSQDIISDLRQEMDRLLKDICLLLARALLACERGHSRTKRLEEMGFNLSGEQVRDSGVSIYVPSLLYAFLVVSALLFVFFSSLNLVSNPAVMVVMIGLTQVFALACAIYPKTRFGFANVDIFGRKPIGFVLSAGVVASVLAFAVGLPFRWWIGEPHSWSAALGSALEQGPWLLMAFTTAVVTALLVQDDTWISTESPGRKRIKDALSLGAGMTVAILIVQLLFESLPGDPHYESALIAFPIGCLIGAVVPSAFRLAPRVAHETRSPAEARLAGILQPDGTSAMRRS